MQARPLSLFPVTVAAAVDQDRADFRLEELVAGLSARGRGQGGKAQGHSAANQCPAHRASSQRISHREYPIWHHLAPPLRGGGRAPASVTHVREYTPRAALASSDTSDVVRYSKACRQASYASKPAGWGNPV